MTRYTVIRDALDVLALMSAMLLALMLCACTFPEEGEPLQGCPSCYRPPHDPGHHIDPSAPAGDGSGGASRSSISGWGEESSTGGDAKSEGGGETSTSTDESGGESSGSSSTGEAAYEPAHCDTPDDWSICPDNAVQIHAPDDPLFSCYCATSCASDDDCAPHEWCDPFFAACTVWCDSVQECAALDAVMTCTLWWLDADTFTRACAYPNEAP